MKTASISEAKNNFSRLINAVREGEAVWITDHGVPVARLVPVRDAGQPPSGRISELVRAGLARPPIAPLDTAAFAALPRPTLPDGVSAVRALCDEREEGR